MKYDTREQANRRLGGSVVLFDNNPVYVEGASYADEGNPQETEYKILCRTIPGWVRFWIEEKDFPKLSVYDLPPLGYIYIGGEAIYMSRIPARDGRQGLNNGNVRCSPSENPATRDNGRLHWNFNDFLRKQVLVDALRGNYMSFEAARRKLMEDEDAYSIPFSRVFALKRSPLGFFVLMYKGVEVAWGERDTFKVPEDRKYLLEVMKENGVVVA